MSGLHPPPARQQTAVFGLPSRSSLSRLPGDQSFAVPRRRHSRVDDGEDGGGASSLAVADLVTEITASFALGLELYAQWRRRREQTNHYRKPGSSSTTANCALTTSLGIGARIQTVYGIGLALLGDTYAQGDEPCRRLLRDYRSLLDDQVAALGAAARTPSATGPLDIHAILHTSETVRLGGIQALADQYQRLAACQRGQKYTATTTTTAMIPRELPLPNWRSSSACSTPEVPSTPQPSAAPAAAPAFFPPPPPVPSERWLKPLEDDVMTTAWSVLSSPLVFQSEPPSPPLTPLSPHRSSDRRKGTGSFHRPLAVVPPLPDLATMAAAVEAAATSASASAAAAAAATDNDRYGGSSPVDTASVRTGYSWARPANSVFHIFCPEAMALQVNVHRSVPATRQCRCGFRWDEGGGLAEGGGGGGDASRNESGAVQGKKAKAKSKSAGSSAAGHPRHTPEALLLKDGFGMSRRFLAKSHCEGAHAGYGCVLCISSGLAQTFAAAEQLREHINTSHSKWQMLHDSDLA